MAATFPSPKVAEPKDIFEACKKGSLEQVRKFHLAGARLDGNLKQKHLTPLYLAAQSGNVQVCKHLVSQGLNPFQGLKLGSYRERVFSLMLAAVRQGNAPLIELFFCTRQDFKYETDISQYPRYIAISIMTDNLDVLELLLESEPDFDHKGIVDDVFRELSRPSQGDWSEPPPDSSLVHTRFRRAFPCLYHDVISASSGHCLIPRHDSEEYRACQKTLLRSESRHLHKALIQLCHPFSMFLLDFADKDVLQPADKYGRLPVHELLLPSCGLGCEKCPVIIERIIQIDGGMSVNTPDAKGRLPIHIALHSVRVPKGVPRALISHTNINHKDHPGNSPIHTAHVPSHISMLLATGHVDLSITNNQGQTVLSSASQNIRAEVEALKVLLEADPTLAWRPDASKERKTPLHHARSWTDSRQYLREKAELLLSLPTVENVLCAFSASPIDDNASACEKVREFAHERGLEGAIEVMDRIGFGL